MTKHPNIYLNQEEINFIKQNKGQNPWKIAYNDFMTIDVTNTMKLPIQSVTFAGKIVEGYDEHDYYTEFIYGGWKNCDCAQNGRKCSDLDCCGNVVCDGKRNLDVVNEDAIALKTLSPAVRDLGLAYQLTGDSKYADKAVELINAWCINPDTYMRPRFTKHPGSNYGQSAIDIAIWMQPLFYGADLIWNCPGWNYIDRDAFKNWVRQLLRDIDSIKWYDNWYTDKLAFIATGAVLIEDDALLQDTFDKWISAIPKQIDTEGKSIRGIIRTRSLSYSITHITNMMYIAEIARHHPELGYNLYNYIPNITSYPNKPVLELALDFHAPYIIEPYSWTYQQITPFNKEDASIYEIAYSVKEKPSYIHVINSIGRPIRDYRTLGPITLTHGSIMTTIRRRNKQMVNILTNVGYISMNRLKTWLGLDRLITVSSKPQSFSQAVTYALTDVNSGKTFAIPKFPESCIIKEIRVRSNFISGQQVWRVAFVDNANGIIPTDTSISCRTAEIFAVGDCIYIEDEMAFVSAVNVANNTITVTRGIKGTTPSYHDYGARMETANNGLRLLLFNSSSRKLIDRLSVIQELMSWKGTTNATIAANDKVTKFANSPLNIEKYDFLYIIDGNNSERVSVEGVNKIVKNTSYNNTVYVTDPLLAHATGIEAQKQIIYDIPILFSGGDGNLYCTLHVDEKIDSALYPSGIIVNIEIVIETFNGKFV